MYNSLGCGVFCLWMRARSLPEVTGAQPEEGFAISIGVVLGALHLPSDTARIAPVTSASERTLTSLLVNRL